MTPRFTIGLLLGVSIGALGAVMFAPQLQSTCCDLVKQSLKDKLVGLTK